MGTPHKHAEALRAIADGKTVQYSEFDNGIWTDRPDSYCAKDPITNDEYAWRIKPEPKPDVVWYAAVDSAFDKELGFYATTHHDKGIDSLKLTFDGETGALKSAEVLK